MHAPRRHNPILKRRRKQSGYYVSQLARDTSSPYIPCCSRDVDYSITVPIIHPRSNRNVSSLLDTRQTGRCQPTLQYRFPWLTLLVNRLTTGIIIHASVSTDDATITKGAHASFTRFPRGSIENLRFPRAPLHSSSDHGARLCPSVTPTPSQSDHSRATVTPRTNDFHLDGGLTS